MNEDTPAVNENVALIKQGWLRALLFLITALTVTAIFTSIGLIILAMIEGIDPSTLQTNARDFIRDVGIFANIIMSLFGFLGMLSSAILFRRFLDKKSIRSLGFEPRGFKTDAVFGLLLGFLLIVIGFTILTFLNIISVREIQLNWGLLFGYLIFFIIGALNEEIMIRGYFLNNLMASMNYYIALLVSSLLFALLHLANAHVTILSFINILLAGILLGVYYIHKCNLWLPVALHFSWNFSQGPIFGFEVSGVNTKGIIVQELNGNEIWTGGEFGFEGSLIATLLMLIAIIYLHKKYHMKI
jgi:membrane protease YdiL (CAAX protease family)